MVDCKHIRKGGNKIWENLDYIGEQFLTLVLILASVVIFVTLSFIFNGRAFQNLDPPQLQNVILTLTGMGSIIVVLFISLQFRRQVEQTKLLRQEIESKKPKLIGRYSTHRLLTERANKEWTRYDIEVTNIGENNTSVSDLCITSGGKTLGHRIVGKRSSETILNTANSLIKKPKIIDFPLPDTIRGYETIIFVLDVKDNHLRPKEMNLEFTHAARKDVIII